MTLFAAALSYLRRPAQIPRVVPVEARRWSSLADVMTPDQRTAALRSVASRMR